MPEPSSETRPRRLLERLEASRRQRFVGRTEELGAFQRLLTGETEEVMLFVHGPAGTGKSALLSEFGRIARDLGWTPLTLEGRSLDPSPEGFTQGLRSLLGLEAWASPLEALEKLDKQLLLLDSFESLRPLDAWLRAHFLPGLPEGMRAVLAGREPPEQAWRADSGWRSLLRVLSLRNLRPEESVSLLRARGLPEAALPHLLEFTHGHPLALSLVAETFEQRPAEAPARFDPGAHPDVLRVLLERFVQKLPGPAHRAALEACALVRTTTEGVLAAALDVPDAFELFSWLRSLSFVEEEAQGLRLSEVVREVVAHDLRWRNPDWNAVLHRRVRAHYTRRLTLARGLEQQQLLFEDLYLHRLNPMVRPFISWGEFGTVWAEPMRPEDAPEVLELLTQFEGEAQRGRVMHWLECAPEAFTVYRDAAGGVAGALCKLELHRLPRSALEYDPFTRALAGALERAGGLREGEAAIAFRFWAAREGGQGVSSAQSLIFIHAVQAYLSTPKLAWSAFPVADPEFWRPAFAYMDLHPLSLEGLRMGGKPAEVFARDWRAGIAPWLEMLGERELRTESLPPPASAARARGGASQPARIRGCVQSVPARLHPPARTGQKSPVALEAGLEQRRRAALAGEPAQTPLGRRAGPQPQPARPQTLPRPRAHLL